MSSYARLLLGSLELGVTRNGIDPGLIWLFRPSDKHVKRIDWRNRDLLAKYVRKEWLDEYDEDNQFTLVAYCCTAAVARDRLDIKGFTYDVAKASFESGLRDYTLHLRDFSSRTSIFEERRKLLESLTVQDWLYAFVRIREEHLTTELLDGLSPSDAQLPLLRYMLGESRDYLGFPGFDFRHLVRLIIEEVPLNEQIVYDLSDLIEGGWVDETDDLIAAAESLMNEDFLLSHRVIVLTEGETDKSFLERSLRLLYPHLSDYFHFFEFTGAKNSRSGGGAGELANLVRAFVAADVKHRILAIFDNDTAAKSSLTNLAVDALPKNISIRHYPEIELANYYPTLGPTGKERMNVNGLAGSLELYLGVDILKNTDGEFPPVQWSGRDQKTGTYQGVVVEKQRIQRDFEKKLYLCESNPDLVDSYDWEGIRAIINMVLKAFHGVDSAAILNGDFYK